MRIGKICFLLDPDKPELENVINACVRLQEICNKRLLNNLVEYWVGGTTAGGNDVKNCLKVLKEKNLGQRLIYPGKITHLLGYPYANSLLVPYLLNWTNLTAFIHNIIGVSLSKFYRKRQFFGYLVLSNRSSVGKLIGANNLSNKECIEVIRRFLSKSKIKSIYLEAGSGSKKPVDIKLVKEASKIIHRYPSGKLIVGGGIKSSREIKRLFHMGVDKVVIGTALEKSDMEGSLAVITSLIKPFNVL